METTTDAYEIKVQSGMLQLTKKPDAKVNFDDGVVLKISGTE